MNKKELVRAIALRTSMTQADVSKVIAEFTDVVVEQTMQGDSVNIVGFGSFSVKTRGQRMGVHPTTGKRVNIPESRHLAFKASRKAVPK